MTREQMLKYKFQAYQRIVFTNPRTKEETEMILVAIDFDAETFKVIPIDVEYNENNEYYFPMANCMPSKWLSVHKKPVRINTNE